MTIIDEMTKTATISHCGRYRYDLTRAWSEGDGWCVFCMLNPSTADAGNDDPTIRRCISFAKKFGCAGLAVVNLFAWRATDPAVLRKTVDPIGAENDAKIIEWESKARFVVAAWGTHGGHGGRGGRVAELLRSNGRVLHCLRRSKGGYPCHPLYLPSACDLIPFEAV